MLQKGPFLRHRLSNARAVEVRPYGPQVVVGSSDQITRYSDSEAAAELLLAHEWPCRNGPAGAFREGRAGI
jgi:hypothetical protein